MGRFGVLLWKLGENIQQDMYSLQRETTGSAKLHLLDHRYEDIACDVSRETCMAANNIERETQQMEKDQ